MPIGVAINGAAGRMGRMVAHAIADENDLSLVLALERSDSEFLGQDAGLLAGIWRSQCAISNAGGQNNR